MSGRFLSFSLNQPSGLEMHVIVLFFFLKKICKNDFHFRVISRETSFSSNLFLKKRKLALITAQ